MKCDYSPTAVSQFLAMLGHREAGGCTELRMFPKQRGYIQLNGHRVYVGKTVSGYYENPSQLAKDLAHFDEKADIYITLNPVKRDLLARAANRLDYTADTTTSDPDILADLWFPLDFDPVRPAKISSTDKELELARQRCLAVCEFLRDLGLTPIVGLSGNGYHALIRLVGYPNTEETVAHKKRLLQFLARQFSDDKVKVDETVFNMARIWKVYGVMAVKGDNLPERPHRRSFLEIPSQLPEPVDLYAMVDDIIPTNWKPHGTETTANTRRTAHQSGDYPRLDVERYLKHYGHDYTPKHKDGRTLYVLEHCLFNPDHNGADAALIQEANGQMGYKCFHNSCADKGWQDAKAAIGDPKPFYQHTYSSSTGGRNGSRPEPDLPPFDKRTPQAVWDEIGALDTPSQTAVQKALWDAVVDASYWSLVEMGQFCDRIHEQFGIPKVWIDGWRKAINAEKRKRLRVAQQASDSHLPEINTVDRHLREITQDALLALCQRNNSSPCLFVRGGVLTRVKPYESDTLIVQPLNEKALRGELARTANFVGGKDSEGNPLFLPIAPPTDVVNDLISLPEWEGLPILKGIVHAPVFTNGGVLEKTLGYQPQSQMYYAPDEALDIGEIKTTEEAVEAAKSLILDELLGEFCFADSASRANALALMLLPFVRPLIRGLTPLHLIDAPTEGSGKGLLASVLTIPFKPNGATLMTEGESDEEWRKRITAVLSEAPSHVVIDNISKRLDSGSFAAALTTAYWSDRLLGGNTIVKYPITQTWIATGNNVAMSPEITRRAVWIRLRPDTEDPSQREFRISDLETWALEHRSELVTACLTLIQRWVDAGMPRGKARKGSYNEWASILSGLLDTIGVDGFLGNYTKLNEKANTEMAAWRDFVAAWYEKHGEAVVGVADLFVIASTKVIEDQEGKRIEVGQGLLNELLKSEKERGRRIKLGEFLRQKVDRVYGEFRIIDAGTSHGAGQYQLKRVGESGESEKVDSLTDSPPPNSSHSEDSSDPSESGESGSTLKRKTGGGYTYTNPNPTHVNHVHPPSELAEAETDSPDSPDASEPASPLDNTHGESHGESSKSDSFDSVDVKFLKNCYAEFQNDPFPMEKAIRHAQTAGYDLTEDNKPPLENLRKVLSELKGKQLDDLKLYETGDGIYSIATCRNGRERYVI